MHDSEQQSSSDWQLSPESAQPQVSFTHWSAQQSDGSLHESPSSVQLDDDEHVPVLSHVRMPQQSPSLSHDEPSAAQPHWPLTH